MLIILHSSKFNENGGTTFVFSSAKIGLELFENKKSRNRDSQNYKILSIVYSTIITKISKKPSNYY